MARDQKKQLRNFILDVDGVFTTGQFLYTADGKFAKVFGAHDHDGIKLLRPHMEICAITADRRGMAITEKRIAGDMGIALHLVSEAERLEWIRKNFNPDECVYMGDGIFDARIFPYVGYSIAPANAFFLAREKANYVTQSRSAEGAVAEACLHLIHTFFE